MSDAGEAVARGISDPEDRPTLVTGNRPGLDAALSTLLSEGKVVLRDASAATLYVVRDPGTHLVVLIEPAGESVLRALAEEGSPAAALAEWKDRSEGVLRLLARHRDAELAPIGLMQEVLPGSDPTLLQGGQAATLHHVFAAAIEADPAIAALSARLALHLPASRPMRPDLDGLLSEIAQFEVAERAPAERKRRLADLEAAEAEASRLRGRLVEIEARHAAERAEAEEMREMERDLAQMRYSTLSKDADESETRHAVDLCKAENRRAKLETERNNARQRALRAEEQLKTLTSEIDRILSSSSMRLTAPLRALRRIMSRTRPE